MKKIIVVFLLCSNICGCATILNTKKPSLRSEAALNDAIEHEVVEYRYRYFFGNVLVGLIPVAGLVLCPVSIIVDYYNGSGYAITDKERYKIWKQKYLKKRNDYFNNKEVDEA